MSYKTDKPCTVCGIRTENGNCYDHIKTRGSGGPDEPWNMMPICLKHHNEKGQKGVIWMAETYIWYKHWLCHNGWEFDKFLDRWIHEKDGEWALEKSKN